MYLAPWYLWNVPFIAFSWWKLFPSFSNQGFNIFHNSVVPIFKKTSNGCYLIDDRSSRQLVTIKIVRNEFSHLKEELYFLDLRPPPLLGVLFLPHEPIKTAAAITPMGSDLHRWQVRRSRTHIFRLHFEWLGIEVTWKISRIFKRKYISLKYIYCLANV